MKAREVIRKLLQDGWKEIRQKGSHRIFANPSKSGLVVVPDHGSIDLKPGTLNDILKKAGLK